MFLCKYIYLCDVNVVFLARTQPLPKAHNSSVYAQYTCTCLGNPTPFYDLNYFSFYIS